MDSPILNRLMNGIVDKLYEELGERKDIHELINTFISVKHPDIKIDDQLTDMQLELSCCIESRIMTTIITRLLVKVIEST